MLYYNLLLPLKLQLQILLPCLFKMTLEMMGDYTGSQGLYYEALPEQARLTHSCHLS